MIQIHTIAIGRPQTLTDERGNWRSAIRRTPVSGPIVLGPRGLEGDRVADTKHHGSPAQAVCCHSLDHDTRWNTVYGLMTRPSSSSPATSGRTGRRPARPKLTSAWATSTPRQRASR